MLKFNSSLLYLHLAINMNSNWSSIWISIWIWNGYKQALYWYSCSWDVFCESFVKMLIFLHLSVELSTNRINWQIKFYLYHKSFPYLIVLGDGNSAKGIIPKLYQIILWVLPEDICHHMMHFFTLISMCAEAILFNMIHHLK